jgi:serine/threonine protein kinase
MVGATSSRVSRLVKLEVARWVRRRSPTEPRRRGTVGVVPAVLSLALVYSLWNIAVVTSRLFYDAAASAVPVGRRSVTENGDRVMPRSIYINGYPDPQPLRDPEGTILVSKHVLREWRRIEDDDSYAFVYEKEVPMPDECAPVATWENHSRPNCNAIHELDLPAISLTGELYYVASGGSNDVFRVNNPQDRDVVLKKFSPGRRHHAGIPHTKEYFNFHFDIVRRDAMVMERLTKSNHVLSLHGHCGFAVLVPWADGGTFGSALETVNLEGDRGWRDMSSAKRLKYAVDAAKGLADVHDIDVVHGDLTVNQYLVMSGTLQLGDFNRGILLRKNVTDRNDSFCRFAELQQFATMSAPEVYKNEPKTSAIDVWSLGSVLYHILTGRRVWSDKKADRARDAIVRGELPHISSSILNSPDPVDKILKDALDMCYIYDPSLRATAKEVTAFLDNSHKELN